MFKGFAQSTMSSTFLNNCNLHHDHIRSFCGTVVSSLALGTFGKLNNQEILDLSDDIKTIKMIEKGLTLGVNIIDTSSEFRAGRTQKVAGEAIKRVILSGKLKREEFFVSTCGAMDNRFLLNPNNFYDFIDNCRKHLNLETIDLFYWTQIEKMQQDNGDFYNNLQHYFELCEEAVAQGKVQFYGLHTWDIFRSKSRGTENISLERVVQSAQRAWVKVGKNEKSGFKAIQVPFNLAMPEVALLRTQTIQGEALNFLDAAKCLNLDVSSMIPLFGGRLCHGMPDFLIDNFPQEYSQADASLSWVLGHFNVSTAAVGMKDFEHLEKNLLLMKKKNLDLKTINRVANFLAV